MSVLIENTIIINGDKSQMIDLLSKVINTKQNQFQIDASDWEKEECIYYISPISEESNYEVKTEQNKIQLKATFLSFNEPPINWIERLIEFYPSIQIKLYAYNVTYRAYLIRYNEMNGLQYYKDYYLQIGFFTVKEVAENKIGQLCYIHNGEQIKSKDWNKLIEIDCMEHVKGEFPILKSPFIKYYNTILLKIYRLHDLFSDLGRFLGLQKRKDPIDLLY